MNQLDTKQFNQLLDEKVIYIEKELKNLLPKEIGTQKVIFEAMNYSVLAGGKRLRPMLLMETYLLFGGKHLEWISPFMAAIEMIHTYSLVHDDLPAMDNDEFRRGRKTTHVEYGEAIGILTGDGLLNYAFETALKTFTNIPGNTIDTDNHDEIYDYKDRIIQALKILANKAGIYGMIGGQVIDTHVMDRLTVEENDKKAILQNLNNMYHLKTGALIQASMMIGATLAGANSKEVSIIEEMASDIGIAFQIQDDILDITSTTKEMGKPIHSDERNQKITYVSLLGLEQAKEEVAFYSNKSLKILEKLEKTYPFLQELIVKLITRIK